MPAGTILVTFRSYIDKLLRADRIGSAVCYQTSYYSFERFRGNVLFTEVTVDYLNDYERWMLKQDYSKTTIGIYVRSLRTIFNEAIETGSSSARSILLAGGDTKFQFPGILRKPLRWKMFLISIIMNLHASRSNGQRISGCSLTWTTGSTPKTLPA